MPVGRDPGKANPVVIRAFSDLAPRYEQAMERELRQLWSIGYDEFVGYLLDEMGESNQRNVLDVATGTGRIPMAALARSSQALRFVGLDITPAMLHRAAQETSTAAHRAQVGLVCGSGMQMPFRSEHFDAIVCGLGMHHLDGGRALEEMRRVMRVGGLLVLGCVNAPHLWRSVVGGAAVRLATLLYRLSHPSARSQAESEAVPNLRTGREWLELLSMLGFERIELKRTLAARWPWYPGAAVISAIRAP
jgi:ubiquinone/menaquinone biosynthesis C-methylase UbiE